MTDEGWKNLPLILAAIGLLITSGTAAIVSLYQVIVQKKDRDDAVKDRQEDRKLLEVIHETTNSLSDKRAVAAEESGHAKGMQQGAQEQRAATAGELAAMEMGRAKGIQEEKIRVASMGVIELQDPNVDALKIREAARIAAAKLLEDAEVAAAKILILSVKRPEPLPPAPRGLGNG